MSFLVLSSTAYDMQTSEVVRAYARKNRTSVDFSRSHESHFEGHQTFLSYTLQ
jgi:hypothetical protein